ncbi:MAG: hypothetical protein AB8B83_00220 [Bdellovibrionales bacterium]
MRPTYLKILYLCILTIWCAIIPHDANAQRDRHSRGGSYNLCSDEEPKVRVKLATSKTRYYKNYSARTINQIHNAPSGGTILGLAGGPLVIETRGQFSIRSQDNKACVQLKDVEVLFWAKPVVVIASNFKKGTCEYREVFAHEQKHIRTTRKFIREFAPKLRKEVKEIIKTSRLKIVTRSDNIDDAQAELGDPILARIKQFENSIMPILRSRQMAIDTPEEYARVNAQCDNWGEALARGG